MLQSATIEKYILKQCLEHGLMTYTIQQIWKNVKIFRLTRYKWQIGIPVKCYEKVSYCHGLHTKM